MLGPLEAKGIRRIVRLAYLYIDATMVPESAIILSAKVLRETRSRLQQHKGETSC